MRYPWLPYLLADLVAVVVSYYLTVLFRFRSGMGRAFYNILTQALLEQEAGAVGPAFEAFYYQSAFRIILIIAGVLCFFYALLGMYEGRRCLFRRGVFWRAFLANVAALVLFYAYWYLTRNVYHPRSMFATLVVLNCVLCPLLRGGMDRLLQRVRDRFGMDRVKALVFGSGQEADLIVNGIQTLAPHGVFVGGRFPIEGGDAFQLESIRQAVTAERADMLIVVQPDLRIPQIMQILDLAETLGLPLKILSKHFDILITEARLPCDMVRGTPLVHFDAPARGGRIGPLRHACTFLVASLAFIVALPLMGLLILLIRLTSPGPALFRQRRIGLNRNPFLMYKFRTMRNAAEQQQSEVEDFNESIGALFKMRRDPRITPVGRFLRRFSLDELPQLINVLNGEMAIVGPRPLPDRDYARYEAQWHYTRHNGLPGLTGLWQVSGRSDLDFEQMCILDIYYLRNHTWILDVRLILLTFRSVIFGVGAY